MAKYPDHTVGRLARDVRATCCQHTIPAGTLVRLEEWSSRKYFVICIDRRGCHKTFKTRVRLTT